MPSLRSSLSISAVAAVLLACSFDPCGAAPAEPKPAAAEKPAAAGAIKEVPTPAPSAAPTSPPTPDPTEVSKTCAKAVAALTAGDVKALDSLPPENRTGLMTTPAALHAFTCLAVASGEKRYCEALEGPGKERCLEQLKTVADLKDLPKERIKPDVLYRMCMSGAAKDDCDKLRDAVTEGDASKCAGLGDAGMRDFCAAIASADPTKCKGLPEGEERGRCEAYATDDPSRCAKDSVDCRNMAGAFAKVKKEGLAGVASIDPGAAAAVEGKSACTPLLTDLQRACTD